MRNPTLGLLAVACTFPALPAGAANYQSTVKQLRPTYYYELNETDTAGGAVDSMGNAAAPGVYNGDYVNGPAMVGIPGPLEVFGGIPVPGVGGESNLAHASNNAGHITLGPGADYGANDITVAMFIKAGQGADGGDRIFTNNLADPTKSFQINIGNNGLVLAVDPGLQGSSAERTLYLEDNSGHDKSFLNGNSGWFHVVASTEGATGADRASNLRIWVNGVDRTANLQPDSTGWGIDTNLAKIGGRRENSGDSTTHSGGQDDVAIWLDRVLTDAEVQKLWQAAITEKPDRVRITDISHSAGAGELSISWEGKQGKLYNLRSEIDPSVTDPINWPIFDGKEDLAATPPENTLTIPLPAESQRLFVIEEFNAPPVSIFFTDFENGRGDWTTGGNTGSDPFTNWDFGTPTLVGPLAAFSGTNCFGTNLAADYSNDVGTGGTAPLFLRSPLIDLTNAGGATLIFAQWVDIEGGFDSGQVAVLDADDADAELAIVAAGIGGNDPTDWEQFSVALPAAALGKNVRFEFRFNSDDFTEPGSEQAGWYIDDVNVTVP